MTGRAFLLLVGSAAFSAGCYASVPPSPTARASAPVAPRVIAPDPSTPARLRERFFRERVVVRGTSDWFVFADVDGRPITENEFIRRFRALTGSHELDDMERRRNGEPLVITAVVALAGAALAGSLGAYCAQPDPSTGGPRDCDAFVFAIVIGGGAAIVGSAAFVATLASPDGSAKHHFLSRAHAEAYAELYNEELLSESPRPPVASRDERGVSVHPALTPGFIGVVGSF